MNRHRQHHPHPTSSAEPSVAALCDGEFGGQADLRRILSRLCLQADPEQEQTLLSLICQSHSQKLRRDCKPWRDTI